MPTKLPSSLKLLGRARMAWLTASTLLVAVSEGLGFVLLVPMLGALGDPAEGGAPWTTLLAGFSLAELLMLFVALAAVRTLAELLRALVAQRLVVELVDGLRMRAMQYLLLAEWRFLSGLSTNELRAQVLGTVDRAGRAVQLLADLLRLAFGLAALGLAALAISPAIAGGLALGGLVVLILFAPLRRRASRLGKALGERYRDMYSATGEALDAVRLVKSFDRREHALNALDEAFAGRRRVERRFIVDSGAAKALLQTTGAALLALFVWFAHARMAVPLAALLPLVAIFARSLPMLGQLQQAAQDWAHDRPAMEEVEALIAQAKRHAEPEAAPASPRLTRSLEFRSVSLAYREGHPAVEDVSLIIPAGMLTAITGPSGAGKSTLADLAGGLLAPDSGSILADGVELSGGLRIAWRSRVAYVQQDALLVAGTIRANLLWGRDTASDADLSEALARASAQFVFGLPGGLDHVIGEAGRTLSGGERQRIALARALLREPDLLVLDESTSAVDPGSEQAIATAIAALAGKHTILIIGHRGALTELAERRIYIDGGRAALPE